MIGFFFCHKNNLFLYYEKRKTTTLFWALFYNQGNTNKLKIKQNQKKKNNYSVTLKIIKCELHIG